MNQILTITWGITMLVASLPSAYLFGANDAADSNAALQYWPGMARFALVYHRNMSEEQRKPFYDPVNAPLDEKTIELVRRDGSSVYFIRRGAAMSRCDWGLNLSSGPYTLLSHIDHMRPLASRLCLAARYRFSIDEDEAALGYLGDAMTVAHHLASDGKTVPGLGIGRRIEGQAIQIAARHLPGADREALRQFASRTDALPEWRSMSDIFAAEKEWQLGWMRRTTTEEGLDAIRKGLRFMLDARDEATEEAIEKATAAGKEHFLRLVDETASYYDEAARVLGLPIHEFEEASSAFSRRQQNANIVVKACLRSNLASLRYREAEAEARLAILKAAIAVVLNGPDGLADFQDPFGDGPFEYRQVGDGFKLTSQLKIDGKPFAMTFGEGEK